MLYASYVCQTAGTGIIGGGAPSRITEKHLLWGSQAASPQSRPQWAPKELKMVLRLFKNGLHSLPIAPKSQKRWWLGLRPRPPPPNSERESAFALASLTHRREGRQFPSSPQAPETLGTPLGPSSYEAESTKCSIYSLRCAARTR